MSKKILKYTKFFLLAILLIMILLNVPIYKIYSRNELDIIFKEFVNQNNEKTICLLDYSYTTGASWMILECTNKEMVGQNIVLCSFFDPRLLKDNKEFDMDYLANYIVVFDKIGKIKIDDEIVPILYPDEIGIVFDTKKEKYRINDFTIPGIVKSVFGIFLPKLRLSV